MDQARDRVRAMHYSLRTERAYLNWIKRFILFNNRRHPLELAAADVEHFLSHLAVAGKVAASTQNQALAAARAVRRRGCELLIGLLLQGRLADKFNLLQLSIPVAKPEQNLILLSGQIP